MSARMSGQAPYVVILSGGAEIVGVAIAQALEIAGVGYAVVALRRKSLLRAAAGCARFIDLSAIAGDAVRLHQGLLNALTDLRARSGRKLAIFATEDGGLRALHEFADDVLPIADFPRARRLRYGGLDKAELFDFLLRGPASAYIPPTEVVDDVEAAFDVMERLGDDAIFKPSMKPLDMDLRAMGNAKVVTRMDGEATDSLLRRLRVAWPLSERWVAQSRLLPYELGEQGAWAVRGAGALGSVEFVERWKYPAQGGTGCWVETREGDSFAMAATTILDAIDYIGLAELPFLRSPTGEGRLLEVNARAWLQVGLAERSGLPVVTRTLSALSGNSMAPSVAPIKPRTWINIERAALAVASGSAGARGAMLWSLLKALFHCPILAVYADKVRGARLRWIARIWRVALRRTFGAPSA